MGKERRVMVTLAAGLVAGAAVLLLLVGQTIEVQLAAALAAGLIAALLAWGWAA